MIYRSLGVLFSDPGITIAFGEFHENAGKWSVELKANESYPTVAINPLIGEFIEKNNLQYQVALVTIHSDTMNSIFNGASIAASTGLPVITDLNAIDIELNGNGDFYRSTSAKLGMVREKLDDIDKATCIALMGILRWREEYNFLSSITGASRNSIGGAIWLGQEG